MWLRGRGFVKSRGSNLQRRRGNCAARLMSVCGSSMRNAFNNQAMLCSVTPRPPAGQHRNDPGDNRPSPHHRTCDSQLHGEAVLMILVAL